VIINNWHNVTSDGKPTAPYKQQTKIKIKLKIKKLKNKNIKQIKRLKPTSKEAENA
jgi:hypothetical protein